MADIPFEGSLMQHPASFLTPLSACLLAPWPLGEGRQGFRSVSCLLDSQQKGKGIKVPLDTRFLFPNNFPSAPFCAVRLGPQGAEKASPSPGLVSRVCTPAGQQPPSRLQWLLAGFLGVRVGQLPRLWVHGDGGELAVTVGTCCALWQEYKAVFYECSAMTGYNIMEPMLHMARSVNRNRHPGTLPQLEVADMGSPGGWARRGRNQRWTFCHIPKEI